MGADPGPPDGVESQVLGPSVDYDALQDRKLDVALITGRQTDVDTTHLRVHRISPEVKLTYEAGRVLVEQGESVGRTGVGYVWKSIYCRVHYIYCRLTVFMRIFVYVREY